MKTRPVVQFISLYYAEAIKNGSVTDCVVRCLQQPHRGLPLLQVLQQDQQALREPGVHQDHEHTGMDDQLKVCFNYQRSNAKGMRRLREQHGKA